MEPGTFTLPGCEALHGWAGRLKRGETVQVTPKVEVSSLLRPQWTAPLFGLPAERWSRNQYMSVYQELTACRNAAKKRDDSAAFSRLHQAAKVVGKGGQAMRRVDRFREEAAENVERILGHQASPALPKIVEAAQMALRGKDPTEFVQAERGSYPRLGYLFGDANELAAYADYLTERDRQELIERLNAGKGEVLAKSSAIEKQLADARAAIAAAPATLAGVRSLRELNDSPLLARIGLEEAQALRAELQQRQNAIHAELRRQQAARKARAEAETNRPMDLEPRMTQLFHGEDLQELNFDGLAVGMSKEEAISTLKRQWKYEYDDGMSLDNAFVATRPLHPQLEKERRNGGRLQLGVMDDGTVGQLRYVEHYRAMLVNTQPQAWLHKRLGSPDGIESARGGRLLTWKDGDLRLQVLATNQTDVFWRGAGYASRLAISIWSEDYEQYLADLGERCHQLLEEKRDTGIVGMNEAMWFARHCNLSGNAKDHAGI
ncbi:hypothetical protein CKO31_13195 [Thiohalocapsa halophila]|uniref:Uncharacterized protein n=1 Tax=Thiohalocapsa halophila TaxID=69359 RepID=A0ABS1CIE4_9GAMM|nr:hypothetical protein [Thiohalocapsa halophila]